MRRGNGEGSIIKLSGKRRRPYAVRVTVGWTLEGKQKYKYVSYHEGIREAKAALREYLVNPYDLSTKNITLLDLYKQWESSTDLSKTTIDGYRSAFNQSFQIHKRKIRDVKIPELECAMYELTPSMQGNFKNIMSHIYKQAIKNDIMEKNLADYLVPKKKTPKKRVPFTLEQIEQIKAFNHKYTDIVIILLYTGMRINELLNVTKDNVHLDKRYMRGGLKTKAGQNRIIPIHDEIYPIVERYYNNSSKYLIENNGSRVVYRTFMNVFWSRLQEHLKTDQTPHCTRHTFITQADVCDMNKTALKKIVGHATGDVTDDVYNHKSIQELLYNVNKLKY